MDNKLLDFETLLIKKINTNNKVSMTFQHRQDVIVK